MAKEAKKHDDESKKPLVVLAQAAARKVKNLNALTPAQLRQLEGLLNRMQRADG